MPVMPLEKVIWQKYFPNLYLKSLSFDYSTTLVKLGETGRGNNGQTGNVQLRKGDVNLVVQASNGTWETRTCNLLKSLEAKGLFQPWTSIWSCKNLYYNFKYLHGAERKQNVLEKNPKQKHCIKENQVNLKIYRTRKTNYFEHWWIVCYSTS